MLQNIFRYLDNRLDKQVEYSASFKYVSKCIRFLLAQIKKITSRLRHLTELSLLEKIQKQLVFCFVFLFLFLFRVVFFFFFTSMLLTL